MKFVCKYRAEDGSLKREVIEAASRNEGIRHLKMRGIIPVGITELKDDSAGKERKLLPFVLTLMILVLVLASGIIACTVFGERREPLQPSGGTVHELSSKPNIPHRKHYKVQGDLVDNEIGNVATNKSPRIEEKDIPQTNVVFEERQNIINPVSSNSNPELSRGTDFLLSRILSVEPGDDPGPIPLVFGKDDTGNDEFLESLKTNIKMKSTDSMSALENKKRILEGRMDLLDQINNGLSVKDTLQQAYKLRKRAYEYRQQIEDDIRDWLRENPSEEEIKATLDGFNEKLKQEGIKLLSYEDVKPFDE